MEGMQMKTKMKTKALTILMSLAMAFTMMLMIGGTAHAEADNPVTYTLTYHWSSVEGEDIEGQPAIVYEDIEPGTTINEVLAKHDKAYYDVFFEEEGYEEWGKGTKPLRQYSSTKERNDDYPEGDTVVNSNMDIYCFMLKLIEEDIAVTVKPPVCGVKTDTQKGVDSDFEWNYSSQSNRPVITLPKDAPYMAIPENTSDYNYPATWWSAGKEWNSVYRGTFAGGESYKFTVFLTPQLGWMFKPEGEYNINIEGGELQDYFVEFEMCIEGTTNAVHDWKGATCTEPDKCKGCGLTEGKALGHAYGSWTKLNASQHQKVCQHDKSHVVKENHKWDAGKVTKEATTNATGIKTYTCTVCKATKTEEIHKKTIGTPLARMTSSGDNSLVLTWNKIQGADGYSIYFAYCGETSKHVKTIRGNNTFSWTTSGLKKGRCYKAYVKAYVMKNGKEFYVKCSPLVLAYASGGSNEYTSAKEVTVEKASANLTVGKAFQIKPSIVKQNKNKYLMPTKFAPTFRYMSSDEKIATVNSGGKVTAKGKGSCYIYVYAHNGVSKQVKVTVQ